MDEAKANEQQGESPPEAEAAELQKELSDKQSEAIVALISEPTIARAAVSIGVHDRTLRRWLEQPLFKRAYHAARREAFSHAIGITQRYAPIAVSTLVKVMTDEKTPPGVKVAAAGVMLRFARESIELDDLAERLEALEQAAERELAAGNGSGYR